MKLNDYEEWLKQLVCDYEVHASRIRVIDCMLAFCREQISKLKEQENEKSES